MNDKNKNLEIIEAIKYGRNTNVLNYLYKNSLPQIIKFICKNNGDVDEAKDIFQDAVVSLFTTVKLDKFEDGKDINGFLYTVSRNLWINRVKKRNKQFDISQVELSNFDESNLSNIITKEKEQLIDAFMLKVGEKCRQILKYVIYDNLSMKEIAVLMDFAGETVAKSSHYRCKQKMMELVENDGAMLTFLEDELRY